MTKRINGKSMSGRLIDCVVIFILSCVNLFQIRHKLLYYNVYSEPLFSIMIKYNCLENTEKYKFLSSLLW